MKEITDDQECILMEIKGAKYISYMNQYSLADLRVIYKDFSQTIFKGDLQNLDEMNKKIVWHYFKKFSQELDINISHYLKGEK